MLEFFLDFSVRYHIYVDFITHVFHLYTLSVRYQHRDSLITNKQKQLTNERTKNDDQSLVVVDSMSNKRKSFKIKYHAFLCPQISLKFFFVY